MKKYVFTISIIGNLLLLGALVIHWQYIAMKYSVMYTPPLECDRLRFAYLLKNDAVFTPADEFFKMQSDAKRLPAEVTQSLKLSDIVNQRSQQIEDICNAKLSE